MFGDTGPSTRPETPPIAAGVASPGGHLPATGHDTRVPLAAGLALLATGAVCVAAARRQLRKGQP